MPPAHSASADGRRRALCGALVALGLAPTLPARAADPGFDSNFAGASLRDQDGKPFTFRPLAGKVLLVNFVYTGCSTVCPVQTRALVEVLQALPAPARGGIHFVSVSLDPLYDTPATLKRYADRMGVDLRQWSFVTGRHADVDRLAERLRLFRPDGKRPDDHSTSLWLVDARGRLMLRLNGAPPDIRRVKDELVALHSLSGPRDQVQRRS